MALAALLGSLGDRLVVALGVYSFQQPCLVPWGYPLWMTSLWIAFAGMFGYGLAWLNERRLPAGVLGAVGGPLAYSAGAKLGAIAFTATLAKASLIIGAYWAFIVPALLALRAALPGGPEQKEL